jgi:uncharacterized protein
MSEIITIGLISDTHGLLRKSAVEALTGADMIIHAGDIDNILVLDELELIAPVYAIRGNMDVKPGVSELLAYREVNAGATKIGVIHNRHQAGRYTADRPVSIIIHGHTHKPSIDQTSGVLYINPGSAGPGRFKLPTTIGILELRQGVPVPRIINL